MKPGSLLLRGATATGATALALSTGSAYMSVRGMTELFPLHSVEAGAMMACLELAKTVLAVWLHRYWTRDVASWGLKMPMTVILLLLMVLTALGDYDFLANSRSTDLGSLAHAGAALGFRDLDGLLQVVMAMLLFVFDPSAILLMIGAKITYEEYLASLRPKGPTSQVGPLVLTETGAPRPPVATRAAGADPLALPDRDPLALPDRDPLDLPTGLTA